MVNGTNFMFFKKTEAIVGKTEHWTKYKYLPDSGVFLDFHVRVKEEVIFGVISCTQHG